MEGLNALEAAALQRIAACYPGFEADLGHAIRSCVVTGRENTGAGFFTTLSAKSAVALPPNYRSPLGDAWLNIAGMRHGIGCLLFLTDGYPTLLEGYSIGNEKTAGIDFGRVRFEMRERILPADAWLANR